MRHGIVWTESRDGTFRYSEPKPFSEALDEYKRFDADPKDKVRLGEIRKVKTRVVEPQSKTVEPAPAEPENTKRTKGKSKS